MADQCTGYHAVPIEDTQPDNIQRAAEVMADSIACDRWCIPLAVATLRYR